MIVMFGDKCVQHSHCMNRYLKVKCSIVLNMSIFSSICVSKYKSNRIFWTKVKMQKYKFIYIQWKYKKKVVCSFYN